MIDIEMTCDWVLRYGFGREVFRDQFIVSKINNCLYTGD